MGKVTVSVPIQDRKTRAKGLAGCAALKHAVFIGDHRVRGTLTARRRDGKNGPDGKRFGHGFS